MAATQFDITVAAPINIAFIKYWGKREGGEELILPTNDSFSITLSTEPFRSKTTVVLSDKLTEDELWLNGEKTDIANPRLQNVLGMVRATCPPQRAALKARIVSNNNFPTAAGMASSASGYCALACALVEVFQSTADRSLLSRIGSGSACRSAYGGFVKWLMGTKADGTDCIAQQYVPHSHWPEMNVLCAVVKGVKKDVSSTKGMQISLKTSPMMKPRTETIVPQRMEAVAEAIKNRDFESFVEITMLDSDDLQAVCRTSDPPIVYATEDSFAIIRLVHAYNAAKGKRVLAYTYDAGANAFLFTLDESLPEVVAMLLHHFPTPDDLCCFNRPDVLKAARGIELADNLKDLIGDYPKKELTYLLQSPVGSGPTVLDKSESLVDLETLEPRLTA